MLSIVTLSSFLSTFYFNVLPSFLPLLSTFSPDFCLNVTDGLILDFFFP